MKMCMILIIAKAKMPSATDLAPAWLKAFRQRFSWIKLVTQTHPAYSIIKNSDPDSDSNFVWLKKNTEEKYYRAIEQDNF